MGVSFECNGRTVWDPALRPGQLFFAQLKGLEKVLDTPSGVEEIIAVQDTFAIDAARFATFIETALARMESTNHGALFALMLGCVQVAIALNAEITGAWPTVSERLHFVVEGAQTVLHAIRW